MDVGNLKIFDHLYASAIRGALERKELISMRRYQKLTGEGVIFGIEEGAIEEFLSRRGFHGIKNTDSEFLTKTHFTGVNQRRAVAPAYAIVHATVGAAEPPAGSTSQRA